MSASGPSGPLFGFYDWDRIQVAPTQILFLYPRYEVYRGYIVFAFSVIMFVCLSVCL